MKRVTLFAGHYGSGKTNIAINYALHLRQEGLPVVIADLDIVNPYFRTKDSARELQSAGIELISSEFAGSNVDLPALPQGMYSLVDDKSRYAVLDIGGDDRGSYALGRYADAIKAENDYEMVLVVNKFRPLTATPKQAIAIKNEIEKACGIKFTGVVNNSNLGELTIANDLVESIPYVEEICEKTGLPLLFTSMNERMAKKTEGKIPGEIFILKLQKKVYEEETKWQS